MDYKSFQDIVEEVKNKKPVLFALEGDEKPAQADIDAFEKENGITLPQSIRILFLILAGDISVLPIFILLIKTVLFIC